MENVLRNIFHSIFIIALIAASLQAQFIIKQVEYEIPFSYELVPEDADFESEQEEAIFFMNVPLEQLKKAALQEGNDINAMETFLYLDGDKYASDINTEQGRMSVISNAQDGRIYMIYWEQKKVVSMTTEDLKESEKRASAAIEESLKNMTPEMRAQVKAAMEEEKMEKSTAKQTAEKTGKKRSINGFDCELYLVQKEEGQQTGIWVAKDNLRIVREIGEVSEKFSKVFVTDDEEDSDEWDLIPGMIPVEVREMTDMYMGAPGFNITVIEKIEKKSPPADKFKIPSEKEGFKHTTFSEMSQKMYGN